MKELLLGDLIESALATAGVTKERVSTWMGGPCGCEERQEKLNQLTLWAKRVAKGHIQKARHYLDSILSG